jgi:hypothetical protein
MFFKATKTHWIVTWQLEESEDDERFALEDGRGWMARLAPVRDELLRGDLRSLYIGWLADVGTGMVEDDELEPLRVSGLGQWTAAQQALVEFLEIDEDLLAGAAMGARRSTTGKSHKKMWMHGSRSCPAGAHGDPETAPLGPGAGGRARHPEPVRGMATGVARP